jgi:hypothetical protein
MMMNSIQRCMARALNIGAVAASAALLAACGGGGGGNATVAGIDGTGGPRPAAVAVGAITGFGSIFVNGVEYSTSSSTITVNGASGTEQTLRIGQVVRVSGTIATGGTTGTATTVSYDDNVTGAITAIDLAQNTLTVMGQVVRVTAVTTFDDSSGTPPTLATLLIGNTVEVSGYTDTTGVTVATRIERKAAAGTLEVSGVASSLDSTNMRFNIGALIVNYASATLSGGTLANASCVEARGSTFSATTNALTATRVEVKSCAVGAANGDTGEIEGLVTRLNAGTPPTDFNVGSQRVLTNAQTQFVNSVATALALNVKVEAEGTFDSSLALVATKITFKLDGNLRAIGRVNAVSTANRTASVLGVTVNVSSLTRIEDKSSAQIRPFSLANLNVGDYVDARGSPGAVANSIAAVSFERRNADTRMWLRGFPGAATATSFNLLGATVVVNGSTRYSDNATTLTAFLALVGSRIVEARCSVQCATSFVAEELQAQTP